MKIASRYVNIEMAVLTDRRISAAALKTYACLKAAAIGKPEITFLLDDFIETFGITRQTLYRHLSLLATCAVLRYGSPGSRTFTGEMHVEFLVQAGGSVSKMRNPKNETALNPPPPVKDSDSQTSEEEGVINQAVNAVSKMRQNLKNETAPVSKMRQNGDGFPWAEEVDALLADDAAVETAATTRWMPQASLRSSVCASIYRHVTGFPTYPGDVLPEQVEPVLWHYYEQAAMDEVAAADALRPFWEAWTARKSKNGRPYSRTSVIWLTKWALSGEIPENGANHDNGNHANGGNGSAAAYSEADRAAAERVKARLRAGV